jgi:Peptidase inhibitor I9
MRSPVRRALTASALAATLSAAVLVPLAAAAAPAGVGARNVIVVLGDQHAKLPISAGTRSPRALAAQHDQAPLLAAARRAGVRDLHSFTVVNSFEARATPAQISQLAADPAVRAIYRTARSACRTSRPATRPERQPAQPPAQPVAWRPATGARATRRSQCWSRKPCN